MASPMMSAAAAALIIGLAMVPVAFVTMSEHIGHQMVLSKVVGRDFIKKPGLHRSIFGDSVASTMASPMMSAAALGV